MIVVYADKVEMAPDLETALLQVFGEQAPPDRRDNGLGRGAATDIAEAQRLYDEAVQAQRDGGTRAEYGRLLDELGRILEQLSGPADAPSEPSLDAPPEP